MLKVADDEALSDRADIGFHVTIANASKNELLITLMSQVSVMMTEKMRDIRRLALYSEEMPLNGFISNMPKFTKQSSTRTKPAPAMPCFSICKMSRNLSINSSSKPVKKYQ